LAAICAWRLLLDRLPTRLNLAKRGMQLTDLSCPLCQEYEESGQHLFTTCKMAQNVWDQCEVWEVGWKCQCQTWVYHYSLSKFWSCKLATVC